MFAINHGAQRTVAPYLLWATRRFMESFLPRGAGALGYSEPPTCKFLMHVHQEFVITSLRFMERLRV
jgi:hypothetical protein